jgi:hypothetical protein
MWPNRKMKQFLFGSRNPCYMFGYSPDPARVFASDAERGGKERAIPPVVTFEAQCDTAKDFFIWIRRNLLKSPDSDE